MGTNYYMLKNICSHCARPGRRIHIGKSSMGWCFALRVYRHAKDGPTSLKDWMRAWEVRGTRIENDCHDRISPLQMLNVIAVRIGMPDLRTGLGAAHIPAWPFLRRHAVGVDGCFRHGKGTWDEINEDFS